MKNILVVANYKIHPEFGNLVDENDIDIRFHNSMDDVRLYEDEIEKLDNIVDNKYIYLLFAYSTSKHYGKLINKSNIKLSYFSDLEEAIECGKKIIKFGIYRDNTRIGSIHGEENEDSINVLDYEPYTNYEFMICKILVNRHAFTDDNEYEKYYKDNLQKVKTKEDLYDLLLDLLGGYQINHYTIDGKLYDINIIDKYRNTDNLSLKSLLGYHVEKFTVGDIVKINDPHYKDQLFIIARSLIVDNRTIYNDKDPLHFREGYTLVFKDNPDILLNEFMDDYIFDEDLELVYRKGITI